MLNLVINSWKIAVNEKKIVVAVFIDLKRAFEVIDRDILLLKLKKFGIEGIELQWFESYLSQRRQRTKVNGSEYQNQLRLQFWCSTRYGFGCSTIFIILYQRCTQCGETINNFSVC